MSIRVVAFAFAALLVGCGGDESRAGLVLELASQSACDDTPTAGLGSTGSVDVAIWEETDTGLEPVPLVPAQGEHAGDAPGHIVVPLDTSSQAEIDARNLRGDRLYQVTANLHGAAGEFLAGATRRHVRFAGTTPVRLRLYRFKAVSCAGPAEGGSRPQPRAFHTTVLLPNNDVLLLGGVTGRAPTEPGTSMTGEDEWRGAALQPVVEVYDADEERFYQVSTQRPFARVLFGAVLLPGGPPYRIRIEGGFGADEASAGLRFNRPQRIDRAYHGAPLMPGERAETRPSVELVYDPEARSLTEQAAVVPGYPTAGGNLAGDFSSGAISVPLVLGLEGSGGDRTPVRPRFTLGFWFVGAGGTADSAGLGALQAGRYGATVSQLVPGSDAALVWGGNIDLMTRDEVFGLAGEVLEPGTPLTTAVRGGDGILPRPSAFHTATPLDRGTMREILLAGGLRVDCRGDLTCDSGNQGVTTTYADPSLTVLRPAESGGTWTFTTASVAPAGYLPSIFHAVVSLDHPGDGGTASGRDAVEGPGDSAMIVGGALAAPQRFAPSDQIVMVRLVTGVYVIEGLRPGDGPARLIRARWGHALTPLPGRRILVTGGFEFADPAGMEVVAIASGEVISYGNEPPALSLLDGGTPDSGPADAGPPPDTGLPVDAGPTADAGPDGG